MAQIICRQFMLMSLRYLVGLQSHTTSISLIVEIKGMKMFPIPLREIPYYIKWRFKQLLKRFK